MNSVRKKWAERVGKASSLVAELHIEASEPGSADPPCKIRGRVGVPSRPRTDGERNQIACTLLRQTFLPLLRPNMEVRILDMTVTSIGVLSPMVEAEVNEEGGLSMPKFMWWEKEYVENPYMRALPMKELNQRFFDIMTNTHEISQGGKLGIRMTTQNVEWMRYFQHITTEARLRELPFPLFLDNRYSPDWAKDAFISSIKNKHSSRAYQGLTELTQEQSRGFHLVKYGEHRHMSKFLESGHMLISPSKAFDDEAYNQALKDDENTIRIFGLRTRHGDAIPAHDLPSWWGDRYSMVEFSASMDRDYMLYCMSGTLSPTLFAHFGQAYDSCIIIYDLEKFAKRLKQATTRHFSCEEFVYAAGWLTYIDPLGAMEPISKTPKETQTPIPFLKHFGHAYQDEFRFVWIPRTPRTDFEKVCVSIGPLHDIAEIIRL